MRSRHGDDRRRPRAAAAPRLRGAAPPRPDLPIFDSRVLRLAPEVPDYTRLSDRNVAALAAAYVVEAIACGIMRGRRDLARRAGVRGTIWRDRWDCAALTARLAAHCCESRLKARRP